MDKIEFKITEDGSHTLYVEALDETYHSKHGAIQEGLHVFINAGLNYLNQPKIRVLEIGFGTGLNTFLTLLESRNKNIEIEYTALEKFPLDIEMIKGLNYNNVLSSNLEDVEMFNLMHQIEWEGSKKISQHFYLNKINVDLTNYQTDEIFDIIYFDAFGPQVQPEMWTTPVFEKMYEVLSKGGILVTYCAKGSVKRALKEVGFRVDSLPGPPGKREMTRAVKL